MQKKMIIRCVLISAIFIFLSNNVFAARIKDIASIKGVRQNQLVGYGLIVGLNGTGDGKKAEFTIQSMARMLEKMGMAVDPGDIDVTNVAAVMITADLPPFSRIGSRIDVLVSSIGNASSLRGGTLLFTPLKAADGNVYAVAQGPVSTGGFSASGSGGKVQKNFPTVGRIVSGALIEKEIPFNFNTKKILTLVLRSPDFTTVSRLVDAINVVLLNHGAEAPDAGTVEIKIPDEYKGRIVELVSLIEKINVNPDTDAKVVINERTGTVVMGNDVRISTVAIAHGNLSIEIKESPKVSQPLPFSSGKTTTTPNTNIAIKEESRRLVVMESGISIGEVVRALNALGVSPRDLIAIFQAIKVAGALQAKLEIM